MFLSQFFPQKVKKAVKVFLSLAFSKPYYELVSGPLTYNQDGLATIHNADFVNNPRFSRAYAAGKATESWSGGDPLWRAYMLCWAGEWASHLDGDYVECGVNRGGYSRSVIEYINFERLDKKFWLLDTFQGLVDSCISDDERALGRRAGGYEECFEEVSKTFAAFRNVVIVRGAIPGTLHEVDTDKVAFLSIDMNCVEPEIAAAEYFWDRLVPGAVVILDDYGWVGFDPQKEAFDEFTKSKGASVLSLPTGQGLILKP